MTNTTKTIYLASLLAFSGLQIVRAQNEPRPPRLPEPPPPIVSTAPPPRLSSVLAKNLERQNVDVSRERREQAYAKLLEGQRYIWIISHPRPQATVTAAVGAKLAKQAFQKAIELDPNLSEGYTALAEIALTTPPNDIDEAIMLANIAVKINPDNFGARRILARVFTIKSQLKKGSFDSSSALNAIAEWKEVARLDPRYAEAWAFLSEFYDKLGKPEERIEALQNWLSSAAPVETRYYRAVMGVQEDLSPESASLKLGAALVKVNRLTEAIDILSRAIADDPENTEAINLLKQAVESSTGTSSAVTLQALQQAVFANPDNLVLVELLARVQARAGKTDDAAKSLRSSISKLLETDKVSAANLQISLGDVYAEANRSNEAIAGYEAALKIRGIGENSLMTEDEREFATRVFGKLIQIYKSAGRLDEAKAVIARARLLLGKDDLFADRQLISLLRENGKNQEALQMIRTLRSRMKGDYELLRLEADLLTWMGKVDEGVGLIKTLIGGGKNQSAPSLMYDDFTNYIFISSLYNQARRGREAVASAQQAYAVAKSSEKKQIAHLILASAQETSGDYKSAEEILRSLLKQSPDNPIALNNLGYFLIERNQKIDEALNLIQQALKIDPTNSSYLDSLGWAYFKLGKLAEAERYLKEATSNDATSATLYEHLGDVYQKQGKAELAKATWQKAISFSTDTDSNIRLKNKITNRTAK